MSSTPKSNGHLGMTNDSPGHEQGLGYSWPKWEALHSNWQSWPPAKTTGRKVMTNLDSIIKSRDMTLSTKVCLVKDMVFPVVMDGCVSWTIKKVKHRRTDALKVWCWRRLLRVPWTARRSNQSILKEINPEYSLEGLMLKLKLQSFGHLMQRVDSFEKTLMLGKIEGGRRRGQERMRWLDGIIASMGMSLSSGSWWWTGKPGVLRFTGSQRVRHDWATELNWTESHKPILRVNTRSRQWGESVTLLQISFH